jgi:GAF domain-containing protein
MALDALPSSCSTDDFARLVQNVADPTDRVQRGVDLMAGMVDGCDRASVTLVSGRRLLTAAASDDVVWRGDGWQYELNQGPCFDAVRESRMIVSQDLKTEHRWCRWGPKVIDMLGINATMSVLLYTRRDVFGTLNLYADRAQPWTDGQIEFARVLAGQLAVALADAHEIEHRGRGMVNRTVIGQAEGLLMQRFGISADRAFEYLRRLSQDNNRKLSIIAQEYVATRQLPEVERTPDRGVVTTSGW